jgi:serine phosphatase RsbU (regulator of sigma subunit)
VTGASTQRRRIGVLEARLSLVTSLVLVIVCATLFVELSARERAKLISAKVNAASTLLQVLVTGLAPAIDFGEADDVSSRLHDLRANKDIVGVAVWSDPSKPPISAWTTTDGVPMAAPHEDEPDGATVAPDWVVVTKAVLAPSGARLARVRVVFDLKPENVAFHKERFRLLWMTAGLAMTTALLLGLLARRYVVGPLGRLARAATALAEGDLSARVDVRSNDEIGDLARAFNVMGKAVAFREERLKKEVELARHIQTSILPRSIDISGLEFAATMTPAGQVGGDYYDVLPVNGGCWIGIGDVAGHGLDAGLMMLMIQSIAATLVAQNPQTSPSEIVCVLNEVLFDNIRNRLRRDDHATLTILHYNRSGEIVFAGAHEEIIVYRANAGSCEIVQTPGTWVGGRRDIRSGTVDSSLQLSPGDIVLLHTDGATEIRNEDGQEFGIERLSRELESVADKPIAQIQEHLLLAVGGWGQAADDVTLLAFRYDGGQQAALA